MFYAKAGHFGEKGWRRVSFWKWLWLWVGRYVVGIKVGKKIREV